MSGNLALRDQAILAGFGVLVLYGIAAFAWFGSQEQAWRKAEKRHKTALEQRVNEDKLIRERAKWFSAYETEREKMPQFSSENQNVDTHWLSVVGELAATNHVALQSRQAKGEEQAGDVYVLTLDVRNVEASLKSLTHFLYDLQTAPNTMMDVGRIDVKPNNQQKGYLKVNFTVGCAYMRGE
ncbi:MAG: hypothetical protein MJ138_07465 [Kiritimatiellae bacterium]|nr:hypothetical protein [Kiritimatiellia bacterium]